MLTMSDIGGNTTAILQVQRENGVDAIGNPVIEWKDIPGENADKWRWDPFNFEDGAIGSCCGWLDLVSGTSPVQNYNAKISESSHYFLTDYDSTLANQDPEVCRMLIDGKIYDVQCIDDPMGMHEHLEIYLKAVGGVGSGTN